MEIVLTVIGTVTSGVIVFIIGQILTTIWLAPLQQYKKLKEKIVAILNYYANEYTNVMDSAKIDKKIFDSKTAASDEFRKLSCELSGFIETLSFMKIGIPKKDSLHEAAEKLMFISASFFTPYGDSSSAFKQNQENHKTANEIKALLKCYTKKK